MGCWHFRLRRKLLPYLEGSLDANGVKRMERHLLDCEDCRGLMVRLRAGRHWAQELARLTQASSATPPGFDSLREALQRGAPAASFRPSWQDWLDRLSTPRAVSTLALLVVVQLVLLVASNRGLLFGKRTSAGVGTEAIDLADFRPLSLDQLKSNTQPHVMIEGYVKDVHTDEEEGTVAFKVVQNRRGPGPFVVCEIMSPIQLAPPRDGSLVEVYGVSRYDAQTDRKWYEVNPVLHIKPVNP